MKKYRIFDNIKLFCRFGMEVYKDQVLSLPEQFKLPETRQ